MYGNPDTKSLHSSVSRSNAVSVFFKITHSLFIDIWQKLHKPDEDKNIGCDIFDIKDVS